MLIKTISSLLLLTLATAKCLGQIDTSTNKKIMETNKNPLLCDPDEGICGTQPENLVEPIDGFKREKTLKIVYFSDPICSACWGVEPVVRKLKLEYGNSIDIEYHMGGLLPNWEVMGERVNPSILAAHSEEVSQRYQMPMNGDVWLKDPPQSSYPPSIAFKAAQQQDTIKAEIFLRNIREDLFVRSINISKWENIEKSAKSAGLDLEKLKSDYENIGKRAFEDDLILAKKMGVRGFPCFYVINSSGESEVIYGIKPYAEFEKALLKIDKDVSKDGYYAEWEVLFNKYSSMTTKEFSELMGISFSDAGKTLNDLEAKKQITKYSTKTGDLWTKKL